MFTPSKYQEAIYDEIKDIAKSPRIGRNLSLKANAGCAKTTTIKFSISYIPSKEQVLYLAYNKHIADDYIPKKSLNTTVRTVHSHGFNGILSTIKYGLKKEVIVDNYKVPILVKTMLDAEYIEVGEENNRLLRTLIPKLVSHFKQTLLPVKNENVEFLSEKYELESFYILLENNREKLYIDKEKIEYKINSELISKMCLKIMGICMKVFFPGQSCSIDFDDQVWLPIVRQDIRVKKFPWVIIDESQDLSPDMMKLVLMSVTETGTIIIVGDPNQSIYAFKGADSQSMQKMEKELNAKIFDLPICYRCPTSHVLLAQKFVSSIKPYEENKVGIVEHINEDIFYNSIIKHLPENKDKIIYVLCRNNFPLVKYCFELIRNGYNATIRGANIGKNLIDRVRATKGTKIDEFKKNLKIWMQNEKSSLESSDKSIDMLMDKYETLIALSEDCDNTDELIIKINKIFSESDSSIVFTTVHKIKGFEAETIYILYPELMPSQYAKTKEALEQEINIEYISTTRSKDTLIYVHQIKK